jgi:hypothetical protein
MIFETKVKEDRNSFVSLDPLPESRYMLKLDLDWMDQKIRIDMPYGMAKHLLDQLKIWLDD